MSFTPPAGRGYVGRFAPSPSGPLHEGSLVAAMAGFLDARVHAGRWLLRIEDIDEPRTVPGADRLIMRQLRALGMEWDGGPVWQSRRHALYQRSFDALKAAGGVYGCACTRRDIELALAAQGPGTAKQAAGGLRERPYPGTCRNGLAPGRRTRAWRFRVPDGVERFDDRWQGRQSQDVARDVGDFVLKRADGLWAYQFVVVVDDSHQGVTDIVRGADLLDSTARQRVLARALGLECPRTLHVPLVLDDRGLKLSKQNHAPALDERKPVDTLNAAWRRLGFETLPVSGVPEFWIRARTIWGRRFGAASPARHT
ncbi:MAG TPA: tRNA glutamyl-Q(34) synthetase GluQRS [Burkholderiaceae bacterium]|nr:tRNA glutamyl-Q(34) synthetase GluQRS [Burkholderiaceae bacterium]